MNETQVDILGKDIVPGMVISMDTPYAHFDTEQRLVVATKRVIQRRLLKKWVNEDDDVELLVVTNSNPDPFTVHIKPNAKYSVESIVHFLHSYTGPAIPDGAWVSKQS